jgi:hypothetical protein
MNNREQFEKDYEARGGCLLASVKEKHWETWQAAQAALLAAKGPAVEMRYLHEKGPIDEAAWERLRRKG